MTFTETMAIIIGGLLGYWIIDLLINKSSKNTSENSEFNKKNHSENNNQNYSENSKEESYLASNWHVILDVPKNSNKDQISIAYKKKIRQYHPDKVSSLGEDLRKLAEEKSKEINTAYDYAMSIK